MVHFGIVQNFCLIPEIQIMMIGSNTWLGFKPYRTFVVNQ
jgi:hypothetical protein